MVKPQMNSLVKLPLSVMFSPVETFRMIKRYRRKFTYLPVVLIFFLIICVRVATIYIAHFPLAQIEPKDANIFLEMVKLLVPVITWTAASYAVTTVLGGGAEIREILMAASYAMMPYIVFAVPLAALSRILSAEELALYRILENSMWGWVLLLYLVSVIVLLEFHLVRSIWIIALSILTMLLMWGILILIYALSGNSWAFLQGIALEIWMLFQ